MLIPSFPFAVLNWDQVIAQRHEGKHGFAIWRVRMVGEIRVRLVEYSAGYEADHWCNKGHIIYCVEGEMLTHLTDGRSFMISAGCGYLVGDDNEAHSSSSVQGCKLFIVD